MKRMNRFAAAVIAVLTVISLYACASEPAAETDYTPAPATASQDSGENNSPAVFMFSYNGTDIPIDSDAAPVIAALGDNYSYFEAESCAFKGIDKTYTYPEFVINTYPDGDTDRISNVRFATDTVATAEGLCLGDTIEKMTSVYGSDYVQDVSSYTYTKGNVKLTFIVTDGKISSITYATLKI